MDYVVGFAFTDDGRVALIRKTKPEWQRGLLNGVGGKIEPSDPTPAFAMAREFQEETGVAILNWQEVGAITFPSGIVHVFTTRDALVEKVRTTTEEYVGLYARLDLWAYRHQMVPNLMTLIEASLINPNRHGERPFVQLHFTEPK